MENVLLILHLIIAVSLIAAVLLQRSEGGALGIGGGGGGGMVSSRGQASALSKLTWGLATAFIATSITLAILAGDDPSGGSVIDNLPVQGDGSIPLPDLPPVATDEPAGAPSVPPAAPGLTGDGALPLPLPPAGGDGAGSGSPTGTPAPATPPAAD